MNGLTLRINKVGRGKLKNSIGFAPVDVSTLFIENTGIDAQLKSFIDSTTTDEQLVILKKILDANKDSADAGIIKFLVVVFLQAKVKHPVKCLITRYITKNKSLQDPFTDALSDHISLYIATKHTDYKQYIDVVARFVTCIENFPTGVAALRVVELELAGYLKESLECCVKTLSETTPSPTEKNEIFNLAHLSLRLLLHIVQKSNGDNVDKLILMFNGVRLFIHHLLFDDDVPMDTKSVCGILFLSMNIMEFGPQSWVDLLDPENPDRTLHRLLENEASQLALYSAVAIVVSAERLQSQAVDDVPAIVVLTKKILDIGERSSSDSIFILGVSRTVLQISKQLDKTTARSVGLSLVESILVFVWAHLEHYMDSVRHLTAQVLGCVVRYCARLKTEGDDQAINSLFQALTSLDRTRKSYYVSLTCLTSELGATYVMAMSRDVIVELIAALSSQPVQASATTALETLLQKHASECDTETVNLFWIEPILRHVAANTLESGVLNILENLLARAVKLHEGIINYIIPYIKQSTEANLGQRDVKCILMLLNVARKSGVTSKLSTQASDDEWKGIISYEALKQAAVDAADETRILSLSLIVECHKSTEQFAAGDLALVLRYLRYNINAQAPSFRQLTLSVMKKFMKRFEESYKVLKRQKQHNGADCKVEYYLRFVEDLRRLCFDSLLQGANYSRRCIALQTLVWCEQLDLEGYERTWKAAYVEKLLFHLEDSYEVNKAYALEVLQRCPVELLKIKTYSMSIEIDDVFRQASSLKPTDCVSAAYKLDLLKRKLPEYILQDEQCSTAEPVTYILVRKLLAALREELSVCQRSVVCAARQAPMYGLLHCMGHFVNCVDPQAISNDDSWCDLVAGVVRTCMQVNDAVACVVNNSSPEGHLPMDMEEVVLTDDGNSDGLRLDDGRLVTAQMVLLCAWRSVKEVSLLLGAISGRLTICGEGCEAGSLTVHQMIQIGEHFTSLLAETKHRGAFEQAYVGFTKLLGRLWRCRSVSLHSLPRAWLDELLLVIRSGDKKEKLCATRRSAGLPFMIQALVTTELQVNGNPKGFQECMGSLLELGGAESARAHALNIVRALLRCSALEDSAAAHVGPALLAALKGFQGCTWTERNSSTLLFSALMVRVFGVQRSRDADKLCVRNKMTGRIFFLRYPLLYDFMLDKLQEVSLNEDVELRPSLYPVLLLLARLYPSSLEGTVSNLKLVAYIPHVLSCAKSGVLKTRQLAAKAMVPLISPEQYIPHLESMFKLLNDSTIKRNYCHGILLQLIRLLDAKPKDLNVDQSELVDYVKGTLWVLEQSLGVTPCYIIADEYVKVLNLIVWRLPSLLELDTIKQIVNCLDVLIFHSKTPKINFGRDICLANSTYLYLVLLDKYKINDTVDLVRQGLVHSSYEVVLSVLNYLLILYDSLEIENQFQEHLTTADKTILDKLRNNDEITKLLSIVFNNKYQECRQKSLRVLTLQDKTRKYTIDKEIINIVVKEKLSDYIQNENDNLAHVYFERLLDFVSNMLRDSRLHDCVLLHVIRVVLECSSSDNSDSAREVAVRFWEQNIHHLLGLKLRDWEERERFEFKATIWASVITLLEDDEEMFRQRISDAIARMLQSPSRVIPSVCAEMIRDYIGTGYECEERIALLSILALLDFKSVVCIYDDVGEEARVFDQNERYNIFLEENVWTNECADKIISCCKQDGLDAFVVGLIKKPVFSGTFNKLCGGNVGAFEKMVANNCIFKSDVLNPKIEQFVNRLRVNVFDN